MSKVFYNLTVEGEHIRVTKSLTGRSKTIMVTSPEKIIDRIGSKVQARSHMEVLRNISAMDADEMWDDIILCDFARWACRPKERIAEFWNHGVLPGPNVLDAWMNGRPIAELQRRRIVWFLLAVRVSSVDEWNQLIVEFKDVFDDHTKYLKASED